MGINNLHLEHFFPYNRYYYKSDKSLACDFPAYSKPPPPQTHSHIYWVCQKLLARGNWKNRTKTRCFTITRSYNSFNTGKWCTLQIILWNLYLYFKYIPYKKKKSSTSHNTFKADILFFLLYITFGFYLTGQNL